ncbi:hypothetical protein EHI8A_094200 [Entamoeba histolytica HM-1:IMSS-B]|uniref:Importin N-terminal domain-containing protein n=6 Tax=Entamoeba histolytica TaxID=5759 RepID=C4LSS4_ENTH1|nr:hypothetical protein EHI_152370 [Entamoeba histolytica HM-1:IMSS]EMD49286.1 Hypothetical protein EHI5A_000890 [Entamoeba histolytica KU27]EMH75460.1 hypothetical protein EHI8A_094200 [Entamoeba histolytica HM-1:IMSS-B]EMS10805.1 hypothetical protein KM1_001890 [Entamoeba histolytica HM-3:IMSS]ENY64500.1 hypothetical protein EHI7A_090330 [Entamoeba histolytica HM-1:IMSS-A]GAT91489.1 hypothetical protein CL6EHI_152370 [Entamoeba histolytica]|eukprot:XP_656974.2 hypothetical protein EHI_152370 [Entamoeba histolytica HM-1:IMSS]
MNPFGEENHQTIVHLRELVHTFYSNNNPTIRKEVEHQLTQYLESDSAGKLLQHAVQLGDQELLFFSLNAFYNFIKRRRFSTEIIQQLLQHIMALHQQSNQLPIFLLNKMNSVISYTIAMYILQTKCNPMIVLQSYSSLDLQIQLLHGIYETIDILPYDLSVQLQKLITSFQKEIMTTFIQTNNLSSILILSDAVQYSSTFPKELLSSLLQIVYLSLKNSTYVDYSLDLFSNLFIRASELIEQPFLQMTTQVIQLIILLQTPNALQTLINFSIAFYDAPILIDIIPVLLQYCSTSLENCVDVMEFFEEMYTLYDDTPELESSLQKFSIEYLKILIPLCCVHSFDDESIVTRSKLRAGLNCISEISNSLYFDCLKSFLIQNQSNQMVVESICFLWEAVDKLPQELASVHIHRPN